MVDVVVLEVMELESAPVTDPDKHTEKECKLDVEDDGHSQVLSVRLVQKVQLSDEVDRHHQLDTRDQHRVK